MIKLLYTRRIWKSPQYPRRLHPYLVRQLMRSIRIMGYVIPIIVRKKVNHYEVIDGYARLLALRRLGFRRIRCDVVTLKDEEATAKLIIYNARWDPSSRQAEDRVRR